MIVSDEQIVSVRTASGKQLYQFLSSGYSQLKWTRELREVSICNLGVPPKAGYVRIPDITPWMHWVDVWDGQGRELYWSGPIQSAEQGRDWLALSARDASSLLGRTRCPLTKRWDAADPAEVARELWDAAIDHHGLNIKPISRPDPRGDRFEFSCTADTAMTDNVIKDLTDRGLYWSVVAGIPLLGPAKFEAVATLSEDDFVDGGLSVIRDGANTSNDVLLRAADAVSRGRVEMGGLSLQSIVNIDSMFGVSNTDREAYKYARYNGVIRDAIKVPPGASLHRDTPISMQLLVPSVRLNVEAYGLLSTMELAGVTVNCSSSGVTVGIDLESVNDDLPELVELDQQAQRGRQP
ncbi:hypothetical protein [Mycobacterium aquaticum]|uniref:Minor tail protein n=1 Tax=Mycobacterium aquaticum TaxID=1927124 RepID=A0A1X0B7D3_9MYCO|nr:hypothetical protein [Mycobacterium aquaticum]ORA38119.1 hypothetical protein BST13_05850 [Mycobacterium aquaticum]